MKWATRIRIDPCYDLSLSSRYGKTSCWQWLPAGSLHCRTFSKSQSTGHSCSSTLCGSSDWLCISTSDTCESMGTRLGISLLQRQSTSIWLAKLFDIHCIYWLIHNNLHCKAKIENIINFIIYEFSESDRSTLLGLSEQS